MSLKKIFSNIRGEATSLVILVTMVIITIGILAGGKLMEQRIKTTSKASNAFTCTVILPSGPLYTGVTYTLDSDVQGGSGSYVYLWKTAPISSPNSYGTLVTDNAESIKWTAPNDMSLGTSGTVRLNVTDLGTGQKTYCQSVLEISQETPPLSCNITLPNGPFTSGQTYVLQGNVQGGVAPYHYTWNIFKSSDAALTYGTWTTPTAQDTQWTAPTNSSLGTSGTARLSVVDGSNTSMICQTALQVNFLPAPATPTPTTITTISPMSTPVPTVVKTDVWKYTLNCANGEFSHIESSNGKYIGSYCFEVSINGFSSNTGCGWAGSTSGNGYTGGFYQEGKEYTMRGRIWDSTKTNLLVDESITKICGTAPTFTPMPSTIASSVPFTTITIIPTKTPTPTPTVTKIPTITQIPSIILSASPIPSGTKTPSPSVPSMSPTQPPINCQYKNVGDADCKKDKYNQYINILDYAIWYSEFIHECSTTNLAGCGSDLDGDGSPMDANFNYPGTNYIATDTKVTIFDYAVWIQGFSTTNEPLPTSTIVPSTSVTKTPSPSVTISLPPITVTQPPVKSGIWISPEEVKLRPTSGPEWDLMLSVAKKASATGAQISNQDSNHDVETLAMALVCIRQADPVMCAKARAAVVNAIDTENGGRWLAVGRNLGSYIIAADLLNLHTDSNPASEGSKVQAWLTRFYIKTLQSNNDPNKQVSFRESAWSSGSNSSAQEGFAYTALAAYLKKQEGLDWSWMAFRRYAGDRTSTHKITANDLSWQFKPEDIVGIQDAGAVKNGCRLDGAIANDMSRGGTYSCTPGFTQYPWVGLEGSVPAAVVFQRAGYPAFSVANNALLRAFEYLWGLRQVTGNIGWFDATRSNEIIHLVNIAYKKNFVIVQPVAGGGRTVDFTMWTHPGGL